MKLKPQPDYLRQLEILSPQQLRRFQFTLVGAGGINSAVAILLVKMGVPAEHMTIYDPDGVEAHNLPNQMFFCKHQGLSKVEALKRVIKAFVGDAPRVVPKAIDGTEPLQGIVISGVDSIQSRQAIWAAVRYNARCPLYIDGRMGGLAGLIFTVRPHHPDDVNFYEGSLHPPEASVEEPCTARAIVFNTMFIGSLVANQVKKFVAGEPFSRLISFDLRSLQLSSL
jgi:molybdopterin/thiamine biosynthesis adenylyltransferase